MKWLKEVLDRNAIVNIESPQGRALLAQAIIEALPKHVIAATIRESARAVLAMRIEAAHISLDEVGIAAKAGLETLALEVSGELRNDPELLDLVAMSKIAVEYSKIRTTLEGFARELGNNCAQSVLLMLEVEDDELDAGVAARLDSTDSDAPAVP